MSNRSQGACRLLVAVFAALPAVDPAVAQKPPDAFPTKPVHILVGFTAGSATDITARLIGPKLSDLWGQPVVIDNRSGAGGTIAWAAAAKAPPDGHTITIVSTAFAISYVLQGKSLPYDALKDFRAVTLIGTPTGTLVVAPALGVKSVKELIALAKEKKVIYASTGAGSGTHLGTERFNMAAGIKPVHVAFKGQPEMIVEVVTGRVNFAIVSLGAGMPFIKDGRLVPLAVNTPRRSAHLPDVPSLFEVVPGFERDAAHALMAPAQTPTPVVRQIARDVARVLEMPDVKERLLAMSFDASPTTPEEYDREVRRQVEVFTKVAKALGLIK
ncbi:MAG TPA: tripartite tricarboxylate transporter substrate-binding protein [Burkholderiales bacterium]|nr:tripartite tricarboxylate transporter substrate-binding protein [Burkholderiales bacterium]